MKKLAGAFVALNALDIGLTLHFVGIGVSTEVNPMMVKVLTLPLPLIITYKVVVPLVLVAAVIMVFRQPVLRRFTERQGKVTCLSLFFSVRSIIVELIIAEAGICLLNLAGLFWS